METFEGYYLSRAVNEKDRLLHILFERLDEKYPSGLYEWLDEHSQDAYKEIVDLEGEIDNNFANNGSLEELKAILRAYWIVHMEAIKEWVKN